MFMRVRAIASATLLTCLGLGLGLAVRAQDPPAGGSTVPKPSWKVGDSWVVETVTDRVQERDPKIHKSPAVRWQFKVAAMEKLAGRDCYRLDIKCLANGRVAPDTSLWVDAKTMTLRQLKTQLAVAGQLRTILESYEVAADGATPIVTPLNALPVDLPAFLPAGSKGLDTFQYTSQPLPAGSKDPAILRFAHSVKQDVGVAGAKSLEQLPSKYAKELNAKPVVEVKLQDHSRSVTQLWQQDRPWPVFSDNGRTKATLVSVGQGP